MTRTFPEILSDVWRHRSTGIIELAADVPAQIYCIGGAPVQAERSDRSERLGQILLANGDLTRKQHQQAMDALIERTVGGEDVRLGDVLVDLKLISSSQLYFALRTQVRERILSCFAESDPCEFLEVVEFSDDLTILEPLAVPQLLLDGLQASPIRIALGLLERHAAQYPQLKLPTSEMSARYKLASSQQSLLKKVDGRATVSALLQDTTATETCLLLCALWLGGDASFHDTSRPPTIAPISVDAPATDSPQLRPRTKTIDRVLGEYLRTHGTSDHRALNVDSSASEAEINASYQKQLEQLDALERALTGEQSALEQADEAAAMAPLEITAPNRARLPTIDEQQGQGFLNRVRKRLQNARTRLLEVGNKEVRVGEGRAKSRREFERAMRLIKRVGVNSAHDLDLLKNALAGLEQASSLKRSPDIDLQLAWVRLKLASDASERKKLHAELLAQAKELLKKNGDHQQAHSIAGQLLADTDVKTARAHLRNALRLDRNDRAAAQAIQQLRR